MKSSLLRTFFFIFLFGIPGLLMFHATSKIQSSDDFGITRKNIIFNIPPSYKDAGLENVVYEGIDLKEDCSIYSPELLEQIFHAYNKCPCVQEILSIHRTLPNRILLNARWHLPGAFLPENGSLARSDFLYLIDRTGENILRKVKKEFRSPDYPVMESDFSVLPDNRWQLRPDPDIKDGMAALAVVSRIIPSGSGVRKIEFHGSSKGRNKKDILFSVTGSNWTARIMWGAWYRGDKPFPRYANSVEKKTVELRKRIRDNRLPEYTDLRF